jgi:hypothetical protein
VIGCLSFVNDEVEHILDTDSELGQEWFGVRNADLLSVVLAASLNRVKKCRTAESGLWLLARWVEELRCMGAYGLHFGFVRIGDVDDKRRLEFVPLHEFEVVMRTVWLLFFSPRACREFPQTGIEPCFLAELICMGMIGVPLDSMRNNEHRRSQFAYKGDHLSNILFVDFDVSVWDLEIPAGDCAQNVRGLFRLL